MRKWRKKPIHFTRHPNVCVTVYGSNKDSLLRVVLPFVRYKTWEGFSHLRRTTATEERNKITENAFEFISITTTKGSNRRFYPNVNKKEKYSWRAILFLLVIGIGECKFFSFLPHNFFHWILLKKHILFLCTFCLNIYSIPYSNQTDSAEFS